MSPDQALALIREEAEAYGETVADQPRQGPMYCRSLSVTHGTFTVATYFVRFVSGKKAVAAICESRDPYRTCLFFHLNEGQASLAANLRIVSIIRFDDALANREPPLAPQVVQELGLPPDWEEILPRLPGEGG